MSRGAVRVLGVLRRAGGCLLFVLIFASAAPFTLGFEHSSEIETDPGSGVRIVFNMPFQNAPQSGFVPIQVKITNERHERLSWHVAFQSGGGRQGLQSQYRSSISVGPMQTRETYLFVPRTQLELGRYAYDNMSGTISGPGVARSGFTHPTSSRSGGSPTGFVAMSRTLAADSWSKLESHLKGRKSYTTDLNVVALARGGASGASGRDLRGSPVDLAELPPDERSLAGVAALFLKDTDWATLAPTLRTMITHWVRSGGLLVVVSEGEVQPTLPGLPAPVGSLSVAPLGFGDVEFLRLFDSELPIPEAAETIIGLDSRAVPAWQGDYSPGFWTLPDWVGWPQLNVGMIIGFVCIFALVIGPINLRWFAPPSKRHRLFFTVPALSAGASLVLLGVIVLGDGSGGMGGRNVMICLSPEENRLFLLQEQVSRSRLLVRRNFKIDPSTQFAFTSTEGARNEGRELVQAESGEMGGDWFRSRAVQSHYLRTSVPSRAEVTLVRHDDAAGDPKPPTLLSSVPSALTKVFFVDERNRYWYVDELPTGKPTVLASSTRATYDAALHKMSEVLSRNFQVVVQDTAHRPGHFYALAAPRSEWPQATLPSIDWMRETIFTFGPCTPKGTR